MAKILAFDTATTACTAALWVDGKVAEKFELMPRRHSHLLLPMIDALLSEAGLKLQQCDAIAFGKGPGSFMGLRIAAGMAQGLAFGAGLPVIPVSSLQAFAQTVYWEAHHSPILVGWDARMQQVYWGAYSCCDETGAMRPLKEDCLSDPGQVILPSSSDKWFAAGNAWTLYNPFFSDSVASLRQVTTSLYPTASAVAFLAEQQFLSGQLLKPEEIQLTYLRNAVVSE